MDSSRQVEDKITFIQRSFDSGNYDVVVKECSILFEHTLRKICQQAMATLSYLERCQLHEAESVIGKEKKGFSDFGFGELVGLIRQSDLLKKWSDHTGRDLGLLRSLDFGPLVDLRNRVVHAGDACSRYEAELVFNYLKNLLAFFGFVQIESAVTESFKENTTKSPHKTGSDSKNKVFQHIPARGLIINPLDGSRNISFKVETINLIFGVLRNEILKFSDEEVVRDIFFKAGHQAGELFGKSMSEKWDLDECQPTIIEKIQKWCEFDSDVGWGRLEPDIIVDENAGQLNGFIRLTENFQTYKQKTVNMLECALMFGYIKGVLEAVSGGLDLDINCSSELCPLSNPFRKQCEFNITIGGYINV